MKPFMLTKGQSSRDLTPEEMEYVSGADASTVPDFEDMLTTGATYKDGKFHPDNFPNY